MIKTAYVWDKVSVATKELEEYLNQGYEVISSSLYEYEETKDRIVLGFAAVLVKEC